MTPRAAAHFSCWLSSRPMPCHISHWAPTLAAGHTLVSPGLCDNIHTKTRKRPTQSRFSHALFVPLRRLIHACNCNKLRNFRLNIHPTSSPCHIVVPLLTPGHGRRTNPYPASLKPGLVLDPGRCNRCCIFLRFHPIRSFQDSNHRQSWILRAFVPCSSSQPSFTPTF